MLILLRQCRYIVFSDVYKPSQDAKKVSFMACHSGKLWLAFTNPKFISTSPKNFLISRPGLITQFFFNLNSSKNFTCPWGKLRTEFTSPIAKSTCPGLSDTTFFAHCFLRLAYNLISLNPFAPEPPVTARADPGPFYPL